MSNVSYTVSDVVLRKSGFETVDDAMAWIGERGWIEKTNIWLHVRLENNVYSEHFLMRVEKGKPVFR